MKKKKPNTNDKKQDKKQLKLMLTRQDHAIVTLAANMKETPIGEYIRQCVLSVAKQDVQSVNKLIDNL